jgi:hypothetical protein
MKLGQLPDVIREMPGTALLVKGGPGIGKTEVAQDTFAEMGVPYAKFVAAQETPESVTGFLWVDPAKESCKYFAQKRLRDLDEVWAKDANATCGVIIDEFKGGDRMTHNSLQQFIREHQVGDWLAKGKMWVVALTNRDEDRANVVRLTAPMVNRFIQIDVEQDFDFWRTWAATKGLAKDKVHPDILGWLSAIFVGGEGLKTEKGKEFAREKSLLFCSPAPKDESPFPTPRSHEMASDVLFKFAGREDSLVRELMGGCLGFGAAVEFMAWRKVGKEARNVVEEVLNGKSIRSLDIGMQFFVNSQLTAAYARKTNETTGPIVKYLSELESEYAMLLCHDLAAISDKVTKDKGWMKVVEKHKKVALAGKRT